MKRIYAGVVGLLVASSITGAWAEEVQWRAAGKRPQEPIATTAPAGAPRPVASLGLPVPQKASGSPLASSVIVDPQVRPVSLQMAPYSPRVVRGQDEGSEPVLPEPQWPTDDEKPADKTPPAEPPAAAPLLPRPTAVPTQPAPTATMIQPGMPLTANGSGLASQTALPPFSRWYGSAEYLLWWIKEAPIPPLVTTSPVASQGIIGQPGTVVLFGGNDVDMDERSGGRFNLGFWLDPCLTWGLETNFFFLGERATRFGATSDQFPLLGRPFFNLNNDVEFSQVITDPNRAVGGISVVMPSQLWGTEANLRRNCCRSCFGRLDLIGGFRYLDLHEGVFIQEMGTLLPAVGPLAGSTFRVFDNFDTRNQFYGGQLGAETELRRGRWFVNVRGKVALGVNHQTVTIAGGQTVTSPAGVATNFQGGLLALPSNIGTFRKDDFAVVPEAGVNIGYHITDGLRAYVGYTFLYWNNVLRPGDQIDRVLDVNQIPNFVPGPPATQVRPIVPFRQADFWAQGINFGLEWKY